MIVCVRNKYIQKDRAKHTKHIHNNNFSIKSNEHLSSSKPPLSCTENHFAHLSCLINAFCHATFANDEATIGLRYLVCVLSRLEARANRTATVLISKELDTSGMDSCASVSRSLSLHLKPQTADGHSSRDHKSSANKEFMSCFFLVHSLCLSNANGLVVVFFCSLHNWQFNQFVISFHPVKRQRLIIRTVPRRFANDRCAWFGTHTPHTWLSSMISSSARLLWVYDFLFHLLFMHRSWTSLDAQERASDRCDSVCCGTTACCIAW